MGMDPRSGQYLSADDLKRLLTNNPEDAARFTVRLEGSESDIRRISEAVAAANEPGAEYAETELSDLTALREMCKENKKLARSGNPAKSRKAKVTLKAIEIEVRKIHAAASRRGV